MTVDITLIEEDQVTGPSGAPVTGVMPSLRKEAGASALIGQDALEHATQAIAALAEARRAIVETHKELSVVQGQIGLGAVKLTGDEGEKPPPIERAGERDGRSIRAA